MPRLHGDRGRSNPDNRRKTCERAIVLTTETLFRLGNSRMCITRTNLLSFGVLGRRPTKSGAHGANFQADGWIVWYKNRTWARRTRLTAATSLSLALCGAAGAYAQSVTQTQVVNPNQPIEVAATLTNQPLYQTGPSTTVITSEQIAQHNYQTIAQILRTVPGVELYQTGGPGGLTGVYLRGANDNMTKVIIDGINVADPSAGNMVDFSQIPVQNIQSIQVIRGPQSGLYGADAIGGVIVITTKQPKAFAPPHLAFNFGGGNFGSTSQAGTFTDYERGLHTTLSYDHVQSSDFMSMPLSELPPGASRIPDYSDRKGFTANFAYDVTPALTVGSITHYVVNTLKNTANPGDEWRSISFNRDWFLREYATLHAFNDRLTQTIAFVYTNYNRRYFDPNAYSYPPNPALYTGQRTGVDYNGSFNLTHDEVLVFGAQWYRDSMTANSASGAPFGAHISDNAGFMELNSTLPYNIYNSLSVRLDANSQFGKHVTFREAPVYIFKPTHTRFHASIGTGFDAPSLVDLYQSYPAYGWYANPNLRPETSFGWELGVDQPITSASSALPITVGVTYFHNKLRNLIASNDAGTMDVNIGRATTYGVESYVDIQPFSTLLINASYTYLHAEDDIAHNQLLRRPQNSFSLTATWTPIKALTLASSVDYQGADYDIGYYGTGRYRMPHYTLVNLSATYQVLPQLALYIRGTNLLDHHYQDPDGFLAPTLGVFGGIKINTDL